MRILHINTYYDQKGGAEKYINLVSKYQRANGNIVAVAGLSINRKYDECTEDGLSIGKTLSCRSFVCDFHELLILRRFINEFSPEVIHLHNLQFFSWATLLFLRFVKIFKVQTVHDYGLYCPYIWAINNKQLCRGKGLKECYLCGVSAKKISFVDFVNFVMRRIILKNRACYIVSTKLLAGILRGNGFNDVSIIYHGIEVDNYPVTSVPANRNILYVGRLNEEKGVNVLLKAFMLLSSKYEDVTMDIVGEGPEHDKLIDTVIENKLEKKVNFRGFADNVKQYYANASVVVVPSVWAESLSLVLLEAMLFCRPVVVSNIGGPSEIVVDGETGFKFVPGDHEELSKKIEYVWGNPYLIEKMVRQARSWLEQEYNICGHVLKLDELYRKFLKKVVQ